MPKLAPPAEPQASLADEADGNKTESAYRLLRQAILDAQLLPGAPLRPNALQEVYGMGWTPLREALSRLEAERLVTLQRNRGFSVAPVSMAELDDLTHARQALEVPLLAASLAQGGTAWEEGVILCHHRLKEAALPAGAALGWTELAINRWLDRHEAFHMALLGGGGSAWLMHFYRQTMAQERRHHRVLMIVPLLREAQRHRGQAAPTPAMAALMDATAIAHHTDLMEAALARDLPRATALMAEHVAYKGSVFSHSHNPPPLPPTPVPRVRGPSAKDASR